MSRGNLDVLNRYGVNPASTTTRRSIHFTRWKECPSRCVRESTDERPRARARRVCPDHHFLEAGATQSP